MWQVQRVPRYRMLLEDLIAHTDQGHVDEEPLAEALEKVMEVAKHINVSWLPARSLRVHVPTASRHQHECDPTPSAIPP